VYFFYILVIYFYRRFFYSVIQHITMPRRKSFAKLFANDDKDAAASSAKNFQHERM
jgi:hypothetical protein